MTTAMEPTFVTAGPADAAAVLALMRAFYAEEGLDFEEARARGALGPLLADPALGTVWLVRAGDARLGYAVVTLGYSLEFAGRFALLDEIYLRPEARGRGLGAALLGHVEAVCRAAGLSAIRLEVERHNGHARALYGRAGYAAHDRDLMTLFLR